MTSEEGTNPKPGEKVLLYLNRDFYPVTRNIGPQHFVVPGNKQGKFTLAEDGTHKMKRTLHLFYLANLTDYNFMHYVSM